MCILFEYKHGPLFDQKYHLTPPPLQILVFTRTCILMLDYMV